MSEDRGLVIGVGMLCAFTVIYLLAHVVAACMIGAT